MKRSATIVATLLLAACGGQAGNEQDSNAAGNQAGSSGGSGNGGLDGAASVALQPGMWETTVEVTRMNMGNVPNMPAGANPPMPPPTTVSYCLTAEQAAQPNANFLTGSGDTGGCTYQNFNMAGGRISGTVTCENAGTNMRSTLNGQFTPTGYEMNTQVQTTASGMTMDMETRTTARRTGDCPAG